MIIVAGEIRMQPGTRDRFFDAVAPMVAATRRESGCRTYAFTPDPDDADLIRLFELWDDAATLDDHFASAHMAEWRERGRDLPVLERTITKYSITDATALG